MRHEHSPDEPISRRKALRLLAPGDFCINGFKVSESTHANFSNWQPGCGFWDKAGAGILDVWMSPWIYLAVDGELWLRFIPVRKPST